MACCLVSVKRGRFSVGKNMFIPVYTYTHTKLKNFYEDHKNCSTLQYFMKSRMEMHQVEHNNFQMKMSNVSFITLALSICIYDLHNVQLSSFCTINPCTKTNSFSLRTISETFNAFHFPKQKISNGCSISPHRSTLLKVHGFISLWSRSLQV